MASLVEVVEALKKTPKGQLSYSSALSSPQQQLVGISSSVYYTFLSFFTVIIIIIIIIIIIDFNLPYRHLLIVFLVLLGFRFQTRLFRSTLNHAQLLLPLPLPIQHSQTLRMSHDNHVIIIVCALFQRETWRWERGIIAGHSTSLSFSGSFLSLFGACNGH